MLEKLKQLLNEEFDSLSQVLLGRHKQQAGP